MLKINLMPAELQAVQKRQRTKSCAHKIILLLAAVLLVASLLLRLQVEQIKEKTKLMAVQRASWEKEIVLYEAAVSLDKQIKQKRILLQQAIATSFDWAQLLQEIFSSASDNISLTKLTAAWGNKQFLVDAEGIAKEHIALSQWLSALKKKNTLLEVHVNSVKMLEREKKEKLHFAVRITTEGGGPYEQSAGK